MESQPPQYHQSFGGDYRGRGRGGRFYSRGRGRGRFNDTRDTSKVECFRCDKLRHYASSYLDRLLKLQEAQENGNTNTKEADELMMHEVMFINDGSLSQ